MRIRARWAVVLLALLMTAAFVVPVSGVASAGEDETVTSTETPPEPTTEPTLPTVEEPPPVEEPTVPTTAAPPTTVAPPETPLASGDTTTGFTPPPAAASRSFPGIESHGSTRSVTIAKTAPSGTFNFRVQRCTFQIGICFTWSTVSSPSVAGGASTVVNLSNDGLHRVQELTGPGGSPGVPSGWLLTGAGCTGTSTGIDSGATFTIGHSNPTPTCTFTNVPLAPSVTVTKASGSPSRAFDIDVQKCSVNLFGLCVGSWSTVSGGSLSLTNDGSGSTVDLTELGLYRAVEDVPNGWRLIDVTCSGGPSAQEPLLGTYTGRTFELTAEAQTRSCTFTNSSTAITIAKATSPAGATQAFDIEFEECGTSVLFACVGTWNTYPGSPVSLADGQSTTFSELDNRLTDRLYRVRESTLPTGWSLDDISCAGEGVFVQNNGDEALVLFRILNQNSPANATCTVSNSAAPASITIEQVTDPAVSAQPFTVTTTGVPGVPANFQLITDGTPSAAFTNLPPNEYSFTEDLTGLTGWSLVDLSCNDDSGVTIVDATVTIALSPGQEITCTYETALAASIEVAKITDPSGGVGFDFTFEDLDGGGPAQEFTLDDAGSQLFPDLAPTGDGDGYEILETGLPADWELDSIDCGGASVTEVTDGVIVDLGGGEQVVCTFANTSPLEPALTVTKTPDVEVATAGDTVTYEYTVENTGPVQVTEVALVDDPLGPVTLDDPDGILEPGEQASGTLTREVTEADTGTTLVNSRSRRARSSAAHRETSARWRPRKPRSRPSAALARSSRHRLTPRSTWSRSTPTSS